MLTHRNLRIAPLRPRPNVSRMPKPITSPHLITSSAWGMGLPGMITLNDIDCRLSRRNSAGGGSPHGNDHRHYRVIRDHSGIARSRRRPVGARDGHDSAAIDRERGG